jgi:hypothetical protein
MGSRGRTPFSRSRREHATDPAQSNRRCRQGEPSRKHKNACGFRAATPHDARLGAGERRRYSHASRAASVEHGPFPVGAEQTPAARRDRDERAACGTAWVVRAAFREQQQDSDARAHTRVRRSRVYIPRRVRHRPPSARGARDRASALERTERRPSCTTPCFGLAPYAKRRLGTRHVHVEEPTGDRPQSEAGTQGKLPATTERRLGTSTGSAWAVWRFG